MTSHSLRNPYRYKEKDRAFFTVPAEELAPWLLGKIICHHVPGEKEPRKFQINVVEAYGIDDPFCHANKEYTDKKRKGATTQLEIGGTLYTHGRNCFDIVAENIGRAGGVLIRGARNLNNDPNGDYYNKEKGNPKKLSFALKIEPWMNGVDLLKKENEVLGLGEELWIEDVGFDSKGKYSKGERINLDKVKVPKGIEDDRMQEFEKYRDKKWRFFLKENEV